MKKLTLLFALVVLLVPSAAIAQSISGSVVEAETGMPLSGSVSPNVYVELQKIVGGQAGWANGSDCYNFNSLCPDANGRFSVSSSYDGQPLSGQYVVRVWSMMHQMVTRTVEVGSRGLELGDIVLSRQPAGFYATSFVQTPTSMIVKGRVYKNTEGPAPAIVVKLTYNGPGVTTPYVNFEADSREVVWESDKLSTEMVLTIALDAKLAEGSTFSGAITVRRADSGFRQYSQNYFMGVKGLLDFIGW